MSATSRALARVGCIVHACAVTGSWYVLFMQDKDIVSVRTWTLLAAIWPLWILALVFPDRVQRLRWLAVLIVGLIILTPTYSTLYSFLVWRIGGFAP